MIAILRIAGAMLLLPGLLVVMLGLATGPNGWEPVFAALGIAGVGMGLLILAELVNLGDGLLEGFKMLAEMQRERPST